MSANNHAQLGTGENVETNAELLGPSQSYKSESVLAFALAGRPKNVETNSALKSEPVGIGACIAHLSNALKRSERETPPCKDFYTHPRDPNYDPSHDMEYVGEADGTSFYKCRKCSYQDEI